MFLSIDTALFNIQMPYWAEFIEEKLQISPLQPKLAAAKSINCLAKICDRPAQDIAKLLAELITIQTQIAELDSLNMDCKQTEPILICSETMSINSLNLTSGIFDIRTVDLLGFISRFKTKGVNLIVRDRRQGRSASLYLYEEGFTKIRYVLSENVTRNE